MNDNIFNNDLYFSFLIKENKLDNYSPIFIIIIYENRDLN